MEDKILNKDDFYIVLFCRNEELYRLNTRDFVESVSIGRNEDCTWSVGQVDTTVSGRHAIISQRKKNFYLTDLGSRNGMYLDERKVKEVCLEPGMTVYFGECSLAMIKPGQRKPPKVKPYFLKYADERGRTIKYKLLPGTIKIGASSKYDIFLDSPLVSSPHASITRKKDGSCWVQDLKSSNGTKVNFAELTSKHARILKNGDVISIADTDFTFWDASGIRERFRHSLAVMTLIVTIADCVTGYLIYQRMTPSAEAYMKAARIAARNADFAAARLLLQKGATARDASSTQEARKQLMTRINTWEHSDTNWKAVQSALENNQLGEVLQRLGNMELRYVSAWDWNEDNMVETRKRVMLVKNGFDTMVRLFALMKDTTAGIKDIEKLRGELELIIAQCDDYQDKYILRMKKECQDYRDFADVGIAGMKAIDDMLARLCQEKKNLDIDSEINVLEKLRKGAPAVLLARIESLLPHFFAIRHAEQLLDKRRKNILDMRFDDNTSMTIDMPQNTLALKSLDMKINDITKTDRELVKISQELDALYRMLEKEDIVPGKDCKAISVFLDNNVMDKVFDCDSLALKLPSKRRKAPHGKFDEIVGIEYLHAMLLMIKTSDSIRSRYDIPLVPRLEQAAAQLRMINDFLNYARQNCDSWASNGKLNDFMNFLNRQLALRDQAVIAVLARAGERGKRQYFIAHGICFGLNSDLYSQDIRAQLGRQYAELRTKLQTLNSNYNDALADEAIDIREKILATGLPGDPVVRRMWSLR